jgi:hypothetical protein
MGILETTEVVSSDGMKKRVEMPKSQQIALFAEEKPWADWKKDLQLCGAGRKSRKRPTQVVGQKPYGKSQMKTKRNLVHVCLLVALLLALPMAGRAQLSFTTNSGAITITGYNTAAGLNVVIPATTNGYPVTSIGYAAFDSSTITSVTIGTNVTSIGDYAFYFCTSLTSVTIPNSVTSIGNDTFYFCASLTSVTIPNSVTSIGNDTFYNCDSLTSVTIPNSVTSIGYGAFGGSALTSVTIPNSVTSIGYGAFAGRALTNITVVASNPDYISLNGILFDQAQATLIQFPGGVGGSYTIPNSVTSIGDNAFQSSGLTNVTIPNSVTSIGNDVFLYCQSLTSVTIPNSVTSIGSGAFFECGSLTSVTIPNNVTSIGDQAFESCPALAGVYFQGNSPTPTNDTSVFSGDTSAIAYYLPGATGWGATFDGIPTKLLLPPPALAISTYGSQPAVFFPTATGTNFVLQMTTNLSTGPWVTVSNGIAISGIIVTNPPGTAFFRLQ